MNKYTIAATAGAIGFGTAQIAAPEAVLKVFGVPDDHLSPSTKALARAFGVSNLTFGSMMLTKSGRRALLAALPFFLFAEVAAVGLALTQDGGKPLFPALGGGTRVAVALLLWKGSRED